MPASRLTDAQVALALRSFGVYRVKRTQTVCRSYGSALISASVVMALGLRETGLRNIEGGAKWDPVSNRWVAQDDPHQMDVGCFQISRKFHGAELDRMPGVRVGTWSPSVHGATAYDKGYAPRFEQSVQYVVAAMHEDLQYAVDHGIPADGSRLQFAVAAHNAGQGGAMSGYHDGDIDKFTALGDYSAWVLATAKQVTAWLKTHPGWRP